MDKKDARKTTNKSNKSLKSQKNSQHIVSTKPTLQYLNKYDYKLQQQLGRGGYGIVYKVTNRFNNEQNSYALKINFNTVSKQIIFTEMAYLMLAKNSHNLPKLVNIFIQNYSVNMVMQYFQFDPFITFIKQFRLIDVKHYMYELLIGLKSLKSLGIYHRDLKPGNFLYNVQLKRGLIVDFGLAEIDPEFILKLQEKQQKMIKSNQNVSGLQQAIRLYKQINTVLKTIGRNKVGTQTYMPLQSILKLSKQSYQVQIWSAGIIFLQLIIKKFTIFNDFQIHNKPQNLKNTYVVNFIIQLANLFGTNAVIQQINLFGFDIKLPCDIPHHSFRSLACINNYDDQTQDLLTRMLSLCPKSRISVQQALKHSFFDEVRLQHQR